jgi:hypothetical protein
VSTVKLIPGVRPWWSATVRSTISRIAASGVSGVSRMSSLAWAVRGMMVRRWVRDAPSDMKLLMFTVGVRKGVQTALSSHFANTSVASRRKSPWPADHALTRSSMSAIRRDRGRTGFGTMLP